MNNKKHGMVFNALALFLLYNNQVASEFLFIFFYLIKKMNNFLLNDTLTCSFMFKMP